MKKLIITGLSILIFGNANAQSVKLGATVTYASIETVDHNELNSVTIMPVALETAVFFKKSHVHAGYNLSTNSLQLLAVKSFANGIEVYGFGAHSIQSGKKDYVSIGIDYPTLLHDHVALIPFAEVGTNLQSKYMCMIGCTLYLKWKVR